MAWISGWISDDASGPIRCAPSSRPVAGSASTFTTWSPVSPIAQPYAVDAYAV